LKDLVLKHLNLATVQDLIPFVYDKEMTWDKMASLLPLVLRAHADGDAGETHTREMFDMTLVLITFLSSQPVATQLLKDAANHLFECIEAVVRKLGFQQEVRCL